MSFWDVVWFIFISYIFIAYLVLLFRIITDLFRDNDASGIVKAVWMVCLIFLPFITALVYLIARGRGMAERAQEAGERARQQQDDYIRQVAGRSNPADQIAQAHALLDAGQITQGEYESLKSKALV